MGHAAVTFSPYKLIRILSVLVMYLPLEMGEGVSSFGLTLWKAVGQSFCRTSSTCTLLLSISPWSALPLWNLASIWGLFGLVLKGEEKKCLVPTFREFQYG